MLNHQKYGNIQASLELANALEQTNLSDIVRKLRFWNADARDDKSFLNEFKNKATL